MVMPKAQRNKPCPCGSGKKYKHCCGAVRSMKKPTPAGMQRMFIRLLQRVGGEAIFSVDELNQMEYEQMIVEYNPVNDSFKLRCLQKNELVLPQNKILRV